MNRAQVLGHRLKHLLEYEHLGGFVINVDSAYSALLIDQVLDGCLNVA